MSEQTREPAGDAVDGAAGDAVDGAAEHLENSQRLAAEAREGWQDLPEAHEADDARHPGSQGQQAPAD